MYYFRQVQGQVTPLLRGIYVKPATAVVVLGYRGLAAIEPASGHLNADHPKDRCRFRELVGDCILDVVCSGLQHALLLAGHRSQGSHGASGSFASFAGFWS
jgi:hypothetical protein